VTADADETKDAPANGRRFTLTEDERRRVQEARSQRRTRALALARVYARSPALVASTVRAATRGALDAIRDDQGHMWASRMEIARKVAPDAATGVEWHGEEAFMAALGPRLDPSARALEIGVGGGRIARRVAPLVAELVCCDVAAAMLDEARENLSSHSNVRFVQNAGATLGALADSSFDVVYAHDVLLCFELNPALAMLDEIRRVLRPGGSCVVSFVTIDSEAAAERQLANVRAAAARNRFPAIERRAYTSAQVDRMLEVAGVPVCERSYDDEAERGHEHYIVVGEASTPAAPSPAATAGGSR
jgi:ubiquinone/menaquinone biosynthesis C-methylase UbiE